MALITADRVADISTTTGAGAFSVSGTAPTGYRTFSAVMTTSDTCYYGIQHQTANEWEVGLGTYSSANTLTRTTILSSSNSGSAVSFSAGTKDVWIDLPAGRLVQLDTSSKLPAIDGSALTNINGARVLLNTLTASSSAALQDTTSLTSTYRYYEIILENVIPSVVASITLSVYSGGAYQSTNYLGEYVRGRSTAPEGGVNSGTSININLTAVTKNVAPGINSIIRVANPSDTTNYKVFIATSGMFDNTYYVIGSMYGYWNGGTGAITGFQISPSSGNITSGIVKIYGWN